MPIGSNKTDAVVREPPVPKGRVVHARSLAIVVISIAAAYLARLLLEPVIHERMPYVLFVAAVAASTRWAGWTYGVGATGISLVVGTHFFAEPKGRPWFDNSTDAVSAVLFALVATLVIAAMASESSARRRVEAQDAELRAQTAERQRLLVELEESRRLESVGRLAGGVAHDFNNLLTVIVGSADLLRHHPDEADTVAGIRTAALRGAELTKQLLSFARKQMLLLENMDINQVVREAASLARRLIPEDIDIKLELCDSPWRFRGDATQLHQVIMNLVTNARDALPGGGTIRIVTDNVTLDEHAVRHYPEVPPGEYVFLSVVDDGVGMSEDLRQRIFEPFFTTKSKGTGLGLAVSYGIVKQLQGHITVQSESNRGTTFDIYWPRARDDGTAPKTTVRNGAAHEKILTILLVEDDALVRDVAVKMLQRLGHRVLAAESGRAAIALAKATQSIDLLVSDVVMPELNGRELFETLAKDFPDMAVIYVSGYTDNVVLTKGLVGSEVTLVRKPFSRDELSAAIREVLGSSQPR